MILKEGVVIGGIRPELLFALNVCDAVYNAHGQELVITAIKDGKHSATSLHYSGCAADLRTRYFNANEAKVVAQEIRDRLGVDYDVILEKDHIHLEYQPKYR
jgi:hypothetical protein